MVRLALLSKHIVLTDTINNHVYSYPQSGIILIEDELITDVIIRTNPEEYCLLKEQFSDWNIIDYSDLYISPGIIDLNVRSEWEDLSSLTNSAVKFGVTTLVVENGYYHSEKTSGPLHCEVFRVHILNETTQKDLDPSSKIVLKAYLFQPAPNIKNISNLQHVLQLASRYNYPFFIDATLPDARMLYMASPLRLEEVKDRTITGKQSFSTFASSISHGELVSDEEEAEQEDDQDFNIMRWGSLPTVTEKNSLSDKAKTKTLQQPSQSPHHEFPQIVIKTEPARPLIDIYDSLDSRIKASTTNREDLFQAETSTYNYSGQTSYMVMHKTSSNSKLQSFSNSLIGSAELPEKTTSGSHSPNPGIASRLNSRGQSLKLAPLNTSKKPVSNSSYADYKHHLANLPIDWETSGVEKVLECLHPNTQVHFCGLSSAAALNMIRKARSSHKVTSEITSINLCFTSDCVSSGNTRFKNNPPVRGSANNALLWDLIKMKGIDVISSGHAWILDELKLTENFQTALNGVSCLGCSLPSIWFILNKQVLTTQQLEHYLVRLAKWMSKVPAEVLRVGNIKGSIGKGKYADLIVWDPWEKWGLGNDFKYHRTCPFMGLELLGKIKRVYYKGKDKQVVD